MSAFSLQYHILNVIVKIEIKKNISKQTRQLLQMFDPVFFSLIRHFFKNENSIHMFLGNIFQEELKREKKTLGRNHIKLLVYIVTTAN